jgi:hypothetical protein
MSRRRVDSGGFTLNLILANDRPLAISLPENEATLRIDPDADPIFDLQSGTFNLKLNRLIFAER